MIRVSGAITVNASPEAASSYLCDVSNEKDWQADMVHVQLISGTVGEAGSMFERVQLVGGRNIKTSTRLVEHDAGRLVVFQAKGKVIEYTMRYELAREGNATRLTMSFEGEMLGFAAMFEGVASEELQAAVPENLERLRKKLQAA